MKNILITLMVVTGLLMFYSCGGKTEPVTTKPRDENGSFSRPVCSIEEINEISEFLVSQGFKKIPGEQGFTKKSVSITEIFDIFKITVKDFTPVPSAPSTEKYFWWRNCFCIISKDTGERRKITDTNVILDITVCLPDVKK